MSFTETLNLDSIPRARKASSQAPPFTGRPPVGHSSPLYPLMETVDCLPPTRSFLSSTRTWSPFFASKAAQVMPPGPAPTTMTSYFSLLAIPIPPFKPYVPWAVAVPPPGHQHGTPKSPYRLSGKT